MDVLLFFLLWLSDKGQSVSTFLVDVRLSFSPGLLSDWPTGLVWYGNFRALMMLSSTVFPPVYEVWWYCHQPCFLRYMRCDDLCSSTVFPPVYEVRWPLLINRVSSGIWGAMTSAHQPCFLRYMRCGWTLFFTKVSIWNQPCFLRYMRCDDFCSSTVFPPVYEVWMTSDHQGFYLKPTNFSPGKTYFSSEIYNFRLTFSYYVGFSSWLTMFRVPLEIYLLIFEMFLGMFFLILLLVV